VSGALLNVDEVEKADRQSKAESLVYYDRTRIEHLYSPTESFVTSYVRAGIDGERQHKASGKRWDSHIDSPVQVARGHSQWSRGEALLLTNTLDNVIAQLSITENEMAASREELAERIQLIRKAREASLDAETRLNIPSETVNTFNLWEDEKLKEYITLTDPERIARNQPKTFQPSPRKPVMAGAEGGMAEMMASMLAPYMGVDEERVREIAAEVAIDVAGGIVAKTLNINIQTPKGVVTIQGAHKQTDEILFWIGQRKHVYLWGQPGGGKTTVARHVADGLQRTFGYMMLNQMTSPPAILGFTGADAKTYKSTVFREMYGIQSLLCIDELDNCNPNTLTTINGPIENGECQFPDGLLKMHPEFQIIATGNTAGRGGNIMHAGRQSLDAATLARFICIEFTYDLDLEERMVKAAGPKNCQHVLKWIRDVREYVKKNDVKMVVSPREAVNLAIGADYAPFGDEALIHHTVFKGFNPDAIRTLLNNIGTPKFSRYVEPAAEPAKKVGVKAKATATVEEEVAE